MVNQSTAPLDAAFAALAHPVRRAMLERLARSAATVGELAEPFAMSLPAASKHVRVLESAGLLTRQIEGRTHKVLLAPKRLKQAAAWLERHRQFWDGRLDALARYLDEAEPAKGESWPTHKTPTPLGSASSAHSTRARSGSSTRGRVPKRSPGGSRRRQTTRSS